MQGTAPQVDARPSRVAGVCRVGGADRGRQAAVGIISLGELQQTPIKGQQLRVVGKPKDRAGSRRGRPDQMRWGCEHVN